MPELAEMFSTRYDRVATARVDAPGRVNLMGDHIDYNGLSVLPMALQRRVILLLRPRRDRLVRIASTAAGFASREFSASADLPPFPAGDWGNYAKAAVQELAADVAEPRGFDALAHSDIPIASGLSSSSALTVAFALAFLHANERRMETLELAERMAVAERYVGTRGGGMDQAICLGAREGAACRIDFDPLRLHCRDIPPDWTFLVAFSGVRAEKSGPARAAYNARAAECREAIRAMNGALGLPLDADWRRLLSGRTAAELVAIADDALAGDILRRFRHVVTEAGRVARAERALEQGSIAEFGRLLSESHRSLADDYEVSLPELDELVGLATKAGAAGARLTGAGFGGCVVALCEAERARAIEGSLREGYYAARGTPGVGETGLFAARPGAGARVTRL